jgi:hypothetical protein
MKTKISVVIAFLLVCSVSGVAQFRYPGTDPGKAHIQFDDKTAILSNNVLKVQFLVNKGRIEVSGFEDLQTGKKTESIIPLFEIRLSDGKVLTQENFAIKGKPVSGEADLNSASASYSGRVGGKKFEADLVEKKSGLTLHWEAELRDGSNYVKQNFSFRNTGSAEIATVALVKLHSSAGAVKIGMVDGSPVVAGNMFFALEYPLAKIETANDAVTISVSKLSDVLSTVWGVVPEGQLRRGFMYYVERERAHPYHQNLHYNSWFDVSWHDRIFDEKISLDRIKVFGDSLIRKRNVHVNGFLFDDGWDDPKTLWKFHSGFPDGFSNLRSSVKDYNSEIGVWMSPFGGYGPAKELRLQYGKKQDPPFETNKNGFSLSGKVYYNRFMEVTTDFIKKYNIFMFKFDGVGAGIGAGSGDLIEYQKDVESFLALLGDLLKLKPDLYLSLTTGTWPSVYWLKYGDNIWRGGDDTNMTGEGSKRQQWITYRDADVFKNIVKRGPLFPLNSLMTCGICIADNGNPALFEMNDKDISDEIWSFFSTGTNLQELYINPHKLSSSNWDCLAAAAKWAKEREEILRDVHWMGGDPAKGEIYGYAAWSDSRGVISLRNPSSVDKRISFSIKEVFELPAGAEDNYILSEVTTGSKGRKRPAEGNSFMVILKPFEIRVYDAMAK